MTLQDISTALYDLDDTLIEECAIQRYQYIHARHMRKYYRFIITAVAICILTAMLLIVWGAAFPPIELYETTGNVSARYVPAFLVATDNTNACHPYKTEQELFAEADLVFLGTVKEIKQIKMDFDGIIQYRSLITIEVKKCYKGTALAQITIQAEGFGSRVNHTSTDKRLLYELSPGQRGIFLAHSVEVGDKIIVNGCAYDASELCDAKFYDGYRFGFLEQQDGTYKCADNFVTTTQKVFPTLIGYEYEQVQKYVIAMLSKEKSNE